MDETSLEQMKRNLALMKQLKEREQSTPVKALKAAEKALTGRDPDAPTPTNINGEEDMPVMRGPGGRPRIRQGEDLQPMDSDPDYEQKQMEMMRKVEALQELSRRNDAEVGTMTDSDDGYSRMGGSEARVEDEATGRMKARKRMKSDY